ncbi:MAG: hypothetical protein ABIF85_03390 [Nanoarchaeota archaeon]|nr:hypothetical protein [Nanoarchaeota archaeon]MBU4300589.1 hypothetical protein [Nanoarchaeota archaeon]MBU4451735.1 hypothetical protein [Nanoarchaeota archaeon]MCG2723704.1 hypothetical protein [archaeon]
MYEVIIASIVAASITYELNNSRGWGPVAASAAVALFFGVIFYVLGATGFVDGQLAETIPLAAMGASFAGMSSKKAVPNHMWIAVSGAIFSFVFLFSSPAFAGLGGGLGITACVSVVAARGMMMLLKAFRIKNRHTFSYVVVH